MCHRSPREGGWARTEEREHDRSERISTPNIYFRNAGGATVPNDVRLLRLFSLCGGERGGVEVGEGIVEAGGGGDRVSSAVYIFGLRLGMMVGSGGFKHMEMRQCSYGKDTSKKHYVRSKGKLSGHE